MNVELFCIRSTPLEGNARQFAINKLVAANDTNILSGCEHIQKRCLTSTRCTHEGGELPWLNVTENVIQQAQFS
jgi:hypothetical protein